MKKFLLYLLLYLVTLPVFAKNTILIVGDSLSAGYGMEVEQNWVSLLNKRLQEKNYDYQIINISISGNTTSNGLMQLPKALEKYKPHITVIELGGNDGLRGLQLNNIKNNLQRMITLAKEANSKVLLVGLRLPPNYGQDYTEQFQKIFIDLGKQNSIAVVPLFLTGIDENSKLMNSDRIHPTSEAQLLLLDNVWPELEKLLPVS